MADVNVAGAFGDEELEGSPTFSFTKDEATAKRVLRVDWDYIFPIAEVLFGTVFIAGIGVVRRAIHTFPGKPWLVLDGMTAEPMDPGKPTQTTVNGFITNRYPEGGAKLTLSYKTVPWDQEDQEDPETPEGTYLTHRWSLSGEILTLPHRGLEWENANDDGKKSVAADLTPSMIIPTIEHQFTWHFVPDPPFDSIRGLYGMVNNGAFGGAAAETLLFLGAEAQRDTTIEGERTWTLDYRFQEKALKANGQVVTWNHFFRPDAAANDNPWQRIKRKADAKDVYEKGDFDKLFKFEAFAG